jgi:hypothetical protein
MLRQKVNAFLDSRKGSIVPRQLGIKAVSRAFDNIQLSWYLVLLQACVCPPCKLRVDYDIRRSLNEDSWREVRFLEQTCWIYLVVLVFSDNLIKLNALPN